MSDNDLPKCPDCGFVSEFDTYDNGMEKKYRFLYRLMCRRCGHHTPWFYDPCKAVEFWGGNVNETD